MVRGIYWSRKSGHPEEVEAPAVILGFDPGDPESVRRAGSALKDSLGLDHTPAVCGPAHVGALRRLYRRVFRKA